LSVWNYATPITQSDFCSTVATIFTESTVETHCCNSVNRDHYWKTLETMPTGATVGSHCCNNNLRQSIATITFDTIVAFVIRMVVLI
jgi:hypothetical protein